MLFLWFIVVDCWTSEGNCLEMDQEEGSKLPRRKNRNWSYFKFKKNRVEKREKAAQEKKTKLAFLNENLIFKRAKEDVRDPLSKISFGHGSLIAKQLSSFLRHGMKERQYCKVDGSIRYLWTIYANHLCEYIHQFSWANWKDELG